MEIKSIEDFKNVDLSQIEEVYSGWKKWWYSHHIKYSNSPSQIKSMYKMFLKVPHLLVFNDNCVSFSTSTRLNIIYFK